MVLLLVEAQARRSAEPVEQQPQLQKVFFCQAMVRRQPKKQETKWNILTLLPFYPRTGGDSGYFLLSCLWSLQRNESLDETIDLGRRHGLQTAINPPTESASDLKNFVDLPGAVQASSKFIICHTPLCYGWFGMRMPFLLSSKISMHDAYKAQTPLCVRLFRPPSNEMQDLKQCSTSLLKVNKPGLLDSPSTTPNFARLIQPLRRPYKLMAWLWHRAPKGREGIDEVQENYGLCLG